MKVKILNNSGYSLIEIIVVLAIVAIVLSMSFVAVSSFQQTARLNEVTSQIYSKIIDFKSNAIANKYGINAQTKLNKLESLNYNLDISKDGVIANICENTGGMVCIDYLNGYNFQIENENFIIDQSNVNSCKSISFKSNDTNIFLKSSSNQDLTTCCVKIKNVKSNESRVIKIDTLSRSIVYVEYDVNDICNN